MRGRSEAQISVRQGSTQVSEARGAVAQIREAIDQPGLRAVLLFCSAAYDLHELGRALRGSFDCPVVACTSAGQIGAQGYQRGGLTAVSLAGGDLAVRSHLITPLAECRERAAQVAAAVRAQRANAPESRRAFGLLLVDGLSMAEEGLIAALYQSLGLIPLIGGSAGDDLAFRRTAVYWDGAFLSDAAVLSIFETTAPFSAFKLAHFRPTEEKLVITAADPARRIVHEIDGFPAVEAYAARVGVSVDRLDAGVWSRHPVMLRVGAEHYLRSIAKANADGSIAFFCAIEEGLVLTIGEEHDPLEALEQGLREASRAFGEAELVIGCDCILRRLEFEQTGIDDQAGKILAAHKVMGFNTYGEQFNAVHVNQTLTGIALGR